MSKAVLISIRPKWCQKIADGEKTIEVRKTRPRMATPFKCYIYCTLRGMNDFFRAELGGDVARWNREKWGSRKGAVVGEFVCDRIDRLVRVGFDGSGEPARYCVSGADELVQSVDGIREAACLPREELETYLGGHEGYGLHISQMKLYAAPKDLSEFRKACAHDWCCDSCAMHGENNGTCGNESLRLKRPPQSWCYVQEVE